MYYWLLFMNETLNVNLNNIIGKNYKKSSNSYEAVAKANNGNYFNIDNYD